MYRTWFQHPQRSLRIHIRASRFGDLGAPFGPHSAYIVDFQGKWWKIKQKWRKINGKTVRKPENTSENVAKHFIPTQKHIRRHTEPFGASSDRIRAISGLASDFENPMFNNSVEICSSSLSSSQNLIKNSRSVNSTFSEQLFFGQMQIGSRSSEISGPVEPRCGGGVPSLASIAW